MCIRDSASTAAGDSALAAAAAASASHFSLADVISFLHFSHSASSCCASAGLLAQREPGRGPGWLRGVAAHLLPQADGGGRPRLQRQPQRQPQPPAASALASAPALASASASPFSDDLRAAHRRARRGLSAHRHAAQGSHPARAAPSQVCHSHARASPRTGLPMRKQWSETQKADEAQARVALVSRAT